MSMTAGCMSMTAGCMRMTAGCMSMKTGLLSRKTRFLSKNEGFHEECAAIMAEKDGGGGGERPRRRRSSRRRSRCAPGPVPRGGHHRIRRSWSVTGNGSRKLVDQGERHADRRLRRTGGASAARAQCTARGLDAPAGARCTHLVHWSEAPRLQRPIACKRPRPSRSSSKASSTT
jgi:hypothetical protein